MDVLSDFVAQNPLVAAVVGLWLIIAFGDARERTILLDNSWKLLTEPSILHDYPKQLLDKMDQRFDAVMGNPLARRISALQTALTGIVNTQRWQLIGQFGLFLFLVLFFVADAIVIAGVVQILGFELEYLPLFIRSMLGQYSIAITVGTFFSLVVAAFVVFDSFGRSEFTEIGEYEGATGIVVRSGAILVLISSLFCGIFLGVVPFGLTIDLPTWVDTVVVGVCTNILVRANVLITTAIILEQGSKGFFKVIALVIVVLFIVILGIIFLIAKLVFGLYKLVIDVSLRIVLWAIYLVSFLVFSPFDRIIRAPGDFMRFIASLFKRE